MHSWPVPQVWPRSVPRVGDLAIALALAATAQIEIWLAQADGPRAAAAVTAAVIAGALAWRTRAPLRVALVVATGLGCLSVVAPELDVLSVLLALVLALFSLGAGSGPRRAVVGGAASLALVWTAVALSAEASFGSFAFVFIAVSVPLLAGHALHSRERTVDALKIETRRLAQEREAAERVAVAQERARIARELHDVVAHHVSLMVIQAGAGRRIIDIDHRRARDAFASIEHAGRQALAEMPRLLGMLRADAGAPELAPQPGLRDLPALVERVRSSGLSAELQCSGEAIALAPGLELAAYRVVQEALTNTIKHAGASAVNVLVEFKPDELTVAVTDDGRGAQQRADQRTGHGLVGMRERVRLYEGHLTAGAGPTGGHTVQARFPLNERLR